MKEYEKTLLKIDKLFYPEKKVIPITKSVVKKPKDVLRFPYNEPKPFRGDYYG